MAASVFLSYSRSDRGYAEQLVPFLRAADLTVWWDFELYAGEVWTREIAQRINMCDVFLVILTPEAVKSPWVLRELHYASESGKRIVPLLLDACELPLLLAGVHREDVRGGDLPGTQFLVDLGGVASPRRKRFSRRERSTNSALPQFAAQQALLVEEVRWLMAHDRKSSVSITVPGSFLTVQLYRLDLGIRVDIGFGFGRTRIADAQHDSLTRNGWAGVDVSFGPIQKTFAISSVEDHYAAARQIVDALINAHGLESSEPLKVKKRFAR
ncbi:toll/interleukin-1 receptor domain-containing protein [Cryptosporangium arvum]|uniref:TIR domain-containing protein n=1 Tax=Cryptosporangium arvum DSM 44712 TaxID=927661 RepID=A0A010Z4N9_9ACTN|nr:toll/interleukin-1 receptor domain-containing protein [Cryptosporangium arvum]EXG82313.1 TIR domain-containing protein [Cryptosporangium arvum DSM 44712]